MVFVEWNISQVSIMIQKCRRRKGTKVHQQLQLKYSEEKGIFRRKGTWCTSTSPAVAIEYSEAREGGAGRREVKWKSIVWVRLVDWVLHIQIIFEASNRRTRFVAHTIMLYPPVSSWLLYMNCFWLSILLVLCLDRPRTV